MADNADTVRDAALAVFDWLSLRTDDLVRADLIIGFGVFDPKVARRCCALYEKDLAPHIVFTGGVGAGSGDLTMPEAQYYLSVARAEFPHIPQDTYTVEPRSTNTGENVRFTVEMLAGQDPPRRPGREVASAILVADAYRQRRTVLTAMCHMAGVAYQNAPPLTDYEIEKDKFLRNGQDLDSLMLGELDRMRTYPARGFQVATEFPRDVLDAEALLRGA